MNEAKHGLERESREVLLPALRLAYADLLAAVRHDGGAELLISQLLIFARRGKSVLFQLQESLFCFSIEHAGAAKQAGSAVNLGK